MSLPLPPRVGHHVRCDSRRSGWWKVTGVFIRWGEEWLIVVAQTGTIEHWHIGVAEEVK